ncbi:dTMP kinase, partial [Streptomyces griseoluteus]
RRRAAEAAAAADSAARKPSEPERAVPEAPAPGAGDDTAVLRPVRDKASEAEVTAELPQPPAPKGAADETALLPKFSDRDADETAVLPPVSPAEDTAVLPPVRDDAEDRTREIPQLGADGRPRRPRPDWAEETPLDDLPSLADELLGSYDEHDEHDERDRHDDGGRRGRGRRG